MRQISILNFKGGTGKTSLVTNLAYACTQQNKRVLLVDCDLQATLVAFCQSRETQP